MDNLSYIVFICLIVAFGMMLPLVDRKTRDVVLYVMSGICCCLFISEVNYIILGLLDDDLLYTTITVTPITEEIIKAVPILYCAIVITDDRRTLIANAFAVGVGFALMENMVVLLQNTGDATIAWAFVRSFGSGMVHGLCTVMVGYGISYIKKRKKLFWSGTFALLSVAITYHGLYNMLVQSDYRMVGILLPAITYIPITLYLTRELRQNGKKESAGKAEIEKA